MCEPSAVVLDLLLHVMPACDVCQGCTPAPTALLNSPLLLAHGHERVTHRVVTHGTDQLHCWATCGMVPRVLLLLLQSLLAVCVSRPLGCGQEDVGCLSYVAPHATCYLVHLRQPTLSFIEPELLPDKCMLCLLAFLCNGSCLLAGTATAARSPCQVLCWPCGGHVPAAVPAAQGSILMPDYTGTGVLDQCLRVCPAQRPLPQPPEA